MDREDYKIRTYSEILIDPLNTSLDDISIIDIAHALSNTCRFGGHCPRFYSVAEHSLLVEYLVEGDFNLKLAALMHDAEEAYLLDMPSPLKKNFPDYRAAGNALRDTIYKKFGIKGNCFDAIKDADHQAYEIEREVLWDGFKPLTPEEAKRDFLSAFYELESERRVSNLCGHLMT